MIKGINRQVIEVTETGNPYFERALLVVRPSCRDDDESRLREEARRMVNAACGYSGMRLGRRQRLRNRILLALGSAAAGGLISTAILLILR